MLNKLTLPALFALTAAAAALAQPPAHPDVFVSARQQEGAAILQLTTGTLRIKPCAAAVIRVTFVNGSAIPNLSNPAIADAACSNTVFILRESGKDLLIATSGVHVAVNKNSGAVSFRDAQDKPVLSEASWPFPRTVTNTVTDGHETTQASAWFALSADEHIYGLGQHQTGLLDQRNLQLTLSQDNTNISIPFWLSTNGYGLLWNSASVTSWNNRFRPVLAIQSNDAPAVDYFYFAGSTGSSSAVSMFDTILSSYRTLTGIAPLFPRWAYGFWQSRLAYKTSDEITGIAAKYRSLHIPIDSIVLDEGWETPFGSRIFTAQYPGPKQMVDRLHEQHVHLMVSIWPLFEPGSVNKPNVNFEDMQKNGFLITEGPDKLPAYLPGDRLYDAFNPAARQLYWQQAKKALYDLGVDAFWLDSTEPLDAYGEEHGSMLAGAETALGNGSRYANMYPLMTTASIYEGQRAEPEHKRVFTLTRSAFTGQQRNAAAAWSGDTLTNWDSFQRQVPAGLNFALTGLPYWTSDIGGFVGGDPSSPAYRELFIRWFEYGSFCPIFRAHGARASNELWSYGPEAQAILTKYDRLRYRLMPYIYALAARTTLEGYTPMRALSFDFADDPKALSIGDEFMFGPSLLVAPVTQPGATAREVYLPRGADWYDYWTGKKFTGGQEIHRDAPLALLPLYVRAGSIVPLGPDEEYAGEHPSAAIELRVYPGANADTRLYSDDGKTYDYESGQFAWTPIHWSNTTRTLSIAARQGGYQDPYAGRDFNVVLVGANASRGSRRMHGSSQPQQLVLASRAAIHAQ